MNQNITQHQNHKQPDILPPQSKYRNIIFDLGGVLVDFNPKKIIASVFKDEAEIPWYLEQTVYTDEWQGIDRGAMNCPQATASLSRRFKQKDFTRNFSRFITAVPDHLTPLQDGIEILKSVQSKGYGTYILSNLSQVAYNRIINYDFLKTVTGSVYSFQINIAKPDPSIYLHLLNTYNLNPEECIFIDDRQDNIDGGNILGIDGIVCEDHAHVRKELCTYGVLD
jgi:putative hydrolase of the HAD superfamily